MTKPKTEHPVNNRAKLLGFPRSYAFVIGINYYPLVNAGLISAVPDAREIARSLKYRQGFDHVELLLGLTPDAAAEQGADALKGIIYRSRLQETVPGMERPGSGIYRVKNCKALGGLRKVYMRYPFRRMGNRS